MLKKVLCLCIVLTLVKAGWSNTGLQFLNFLSLPRGAALGEAFTALPGNLASFGYNPAGLADLKQTQFAFMHKAWFLDISMNYGGMAMPVGKNVFSLSVVVNSTPDIELRNSATLEPLGTTDAEDIAAGFTWSRKIGKLDVGLGGKLLYEKIHLSSASGWATDWGAQYDWKGIRLGAAVLNLGPKMKFEQSSFSLPTQMRIGLAYKPQKLFLDGNWTFLADLVNPKGMTSYGNFGVEYGYRQQYFARLGYKGSSQNQNDFSFGLGVNYRSYTIDYALVPFKSGLGQSHQVVLIIGL